MGKAINIAGNIYGRLRVLHKDIQQSELKHKSCWVCECECGTIKTIGGDNLKTGHTKSCGCYNSEMAVKHNTTAGGLCGTKIYSIYTNMMRRCYEVTNPTYKYYGGRGISVCGYWKESVVNFYDDMGEPPKDTSLDRIDNNGNYCKENCKWSTREEQSNNRRNNVIVSIDGVTYKLKDAYNIFKPNTSIENVRQRLRYKWSDKKALDIE